MDSDVKVLRALIDTPGIKEYPKGKYEYTEEALQKMAEDFRNQIVELNYHDSGKYGNVMKLGYCPQKGLWADLIVPKDTPEDEITFSSDVQVTGYIDETPGVRTITDAALNKVVYITKDGPDARNPNTRLCNTEEDDPMSGEDELKINELNVKIGELKNKLQDKSQTAEQLEQVKQDLETKLGEKETLISQLQTKLQGYKDAEDKVKQELISEIAGDNEVLKKAYGSLSIKELEELKKGKPVQDTIPKGFKSKTTPTVPSKKEEEDEEPSYADLVEARKRYKF